MREIIFRAWEKTRKRMLDWEYIIDHEYIENLFNEHNDLITMQFTGLKDKNGIEIYEGDILEAVADYPNTVVIFQLGRFVASDKVEDDGTYLYDLHEYDLKVIGNIYEIKYQHLWCGER